MNPFLIIRNNWKKSLFFTSIFGYGAYSLKSYIDVTSHMRTICEDLVANYNESKAPSTVLVVVNPAANKKNAEELFKKFSEPLFHLSGCKVEIFRTENIGHAKKHIESMPDLPDAIVVAGGEGTSSEVVTGLLRRQDIPPPLVLLPLGAKSEKSVKNSSDFLHSKLNYVKALTDSSIALIKGQPQYTNVMKYDVVDQDEEKKLKPVYGLNTFSWGLIKDIDSITDKYWYFGKLRNYAAVLFNSFSNKLNWKFETEFNYTPPCSGCTNCVYENKSANPQPKTGTFLNRFVAFKGENVENSRDITATIINKECEQTKQGHIQTSQLDINCKENEENFFELETRIAEIISPGLETIKNMNKIIKHSVEPTLVLRSRTIELSPRLDSEVQTYYSIDGEEYDARPIKISLLRNAIKVYS